MTKTVESFAGFELHDLVESLDEELATALDEEGFAQNEKMLEIIRMGLAEWHERND